MADYNAIKRPDLVQRKDGSPTVERYRKQEKALETACRQFEGTIFSKLWKDMLKSSRTIGGEERKREYGPLEDTVVEMVSEHLSENQGVGLWKVLYEQLHRHIPVPSELAVEKPSGQKTIPERMKPKD